MINNIGHTFITYKQLESTMTAAKSFLSLADCHGIVIISDTQSGGRGRADKSWCSPLGGIWLSIILRPKFKADDVSVITLISALAVYKTIENLYKLRCHIKWPNDILLEDKKICGILTELVVVGEINYAIVGIGVNTNFKVAELSDELRTIATTLLSGTGIFVDNGVFLKELMGNLNVEFGKPFVSVEEFMGGYSKLMT